MAAPPLDSPCDGPVTYPGDTKILEKSSKGRSEPTLNIYIYIYIYIYISFLSMMSISQNGSVGFQKLTIANLL